MIPPRDYHALPHYGSGDINALVFGGPAALARRMRLKAIDHKLPRPLDSLADELARRSRIHQTAAMRAGSLLESYLFASTDEEHEWAEDGASAREIDAAREEASFVVRHGEPCGGSPALFPNTRAALAMVCSGKAQTQVTRFAELRPGVWCKCRIDLGWMDDDGAWVECDFKRYTDKVFGRHWGDEDDVLCLADKRGAIHQRALYRMILQHRSDTRTRAALLAIDPARSEGQLDLLVEIPEGAMAQASEQIERALDKIAPTIHEEIAA